MLMGVFEILVDSGGKREGVEGEGFDAVGRYEAV
jgi:hypothetical protein